MERKLTAEAQTDRDDFNEMINDLGLSCSCHINAPCTVCEHPGNPINQEDDICWEKTDG